MATRILLRGDTAANWTAANPVLALREEGVETNTNRRKIGDGVTAWTGLPYVVLVPADLDATMAGVVTPGGSQTAAALAGSAELKAAFVQPSGGTFTGSVQFAGPLPFISTTAIGCTGVTDDTAKVQAAINALVAAGGGQLVVDCPILLNGSTTQAGVTWAVGITGDNIEIIGTSTGKITRTTTTGAVFFASGAGKVAPLTSWDSNRFTDTTSYAINAVAKGAVSITTATATDAGNFTAGDYIYVRTGQITSNPPAWPECDSELHEVVTANATTGAITLRKPTGKAYAQEYYSSSSLVGPTTTTSSAWPAPLVVHKVTDRVLKRLSFRNLRFDSATTDRNIISGWQIVGWRIEDCTGVGNSGLQTGRDFTDYTFARNRFHARGTSTSMVYSFAVATGCADGGFYDNTVTGERVAQAHVHEGTVRHKQRGNHWLFTAAGASDAVIDVRARAHDPIFDSEIIGGVFGYGFFVDPTCSDGGLVQGCTTYGSALTSAITYADSSGSWRIGHNDFQAGAQTLASGGGSSGTITPRIISGWVGSAAPLRTVGTIGPNWQIVAIKVYVTTAFSAGATLGIGVGGDPGRYASGIDLTAAGSPTITAGTGANTGHYSESRLSILATVSGSPTVGKAIVTLLLAPAPKQI